LAWWVGRFSRRKTLSPTPEAITAQDWRQIAMTVVWLWVFVVSWVTFALSFGLGHAIIPSLVESRHLPRSVNAVRPIFYVVAILGVAVAFFALFNWLNRLPVIYDIFPRVVI
jgi:ABC-type Na+ efflux pump permease subunit